MANEPVCCEGHPLPQPDDDGLGDYLRDQQKDREWRDDNEG